MQRDALQIISFDISKWCKAGPAELLGDVAARNEQFGGAGIAASQLVGS